MSDGRLRRAEDAGISGKGGGGVRARDAFAEATTKVSCEEITVERRIVAALHFFLGIDDLGLLVGARRLGMSIGGLPRVMTFAKR